MHQSLQLQPLRGPIRSLGFGPRETWFIRYILGKNRFGPTLAALPSSLRSVIISLETHPRKDSFIEFVAFGAHDSVLVRYEDGYSQFVLSTEPGAGEVSAKFIEHVEERLAQGWTVGNRTALCHWDSARWFIEWIRGSSAQFDFEMGEGREEDENRVLAVLGGVGNDVAMVERVQNAHIVRPFPLIVTSIC